MFYVRTCDVASCVDRMREVDIGPGKILVVKDQGKFYAMGNKCSHYAAPLVKGQYFTVPWLLEQHSLVSRLLHGQYSPVP